LSPFRGKRT